MFPQQKIPHAFSGSDEFVIVVWLKQQGDSVEAGEPLLIVRNDRLELVIAAEQTAVLEKQLFAVGEQVVGDTPVAAWQTAPRPMLSTPVARSIAQAHQQDVSLIQGTGPAGRIMKADVLAALGISYPQPISVESDALGQTQIQPSPSVHDLNESQAGVSDPVVLHFDLNAPFALTAMVVNCDSAIQFCSNYNAQSRSRFAITPQLCIVWSALQSLIAYPLVQAQWHDQSIIRRKTTHLQIHDIDNGFIIERNIPNAQDYNIRGLARSWHQSSKPEPFSFHIDLSGSQPFQTHRAALSIGALTQSAIPSESAAIQMQSLVLLTHSYDARLYDQPYADAFLLHIAQGLQRITDIF